MKMPDTGRLAARFDAMLREEAAKSDAYHGEDPAYAYLEMRRQNAAGAPGICASHDFCDANMVMFDAFRDECGREMRLDGSPQALLDRICSNDAWEIAKADYLTEKP